MFVNATPEGVETIRALASGVSSIINLLQAIAAQLQQPAAISRLVLAGSIEISRDLRRLPEQEGVVIFLVNTSAKEVVEVVFDDIEPGALIVPRGTMILSGFKNIAQFALRCQNMTEPFSVGFSVNA